MVALICKNELVGGGLFGGRGVVKDLRGMRDCREMSGWRAKVRYTVQASTCTERSFSFKELLLSP